MMKMRTPPHITAGISHTHRSSLQSFMCKTHCDLKVVPRWKQRCQLCRAYLADKLESIQVVVFAIEAQLDLAIRTLPQRLDHHVLIHKGAPLQAHDRCCTLCGLT